MKYLIKTIAIVGLLFLPLFTFAQISSFQNNLSYGMSNSIEVSALQEFLVAQGVLDGRYVTGNFFFLTLSAVKKFQTLEGITPVSGFVGNLTRGVINGLLAIQAPDSELNATTTSPAVDLSVPVIVPQSTPTQVVPEPIPVFGGAPIVQAVPQTIDVVHNNPKAGEYFTVTVTPILSDGTTDQTAHLTVTSTAPWWYSEYKYGASVCAKGCTITTGVPFKAPYTPSDPGTYTMTVIWGSISTTTTINVLAPQTQ